jgi:hypothetical protein
MPFAFSTDAAAGAVSNFINALAASGSFRIGSDTRRYDGVQLQLCRKRSEELHAPHGYKLAGLNDSELGLAGRNGLGRFTRIYQLGLRLGFLRDAKTLKQTDKISGDGCRAWSGKWRKASAIPCIGLSEAP